VTASANRQDPKSPVSKIFLIMAISGILSDLFYASMIGPFIVFFPGI